MSDDARRGAPRGLADLLEEAARALTGGDAVQAAAALQRATELCLKLGSEGAGLTALELSQAKAAQRQLAELAPQLQEALSQALKSAGDSRRAVAAYGER